jgi:hypothetical protein
MDAPSLPSDVTPQFGDVPLRLGKVFSQQLGRRDWAAP